LARDELRAHLASGNNPMPAAGLPVITYRNPVTLHINADDVQLIPVMNAHTDGDTMVYFPKADVLKIGRASCRGRREITRCDGIRADLVTGVQTCALPISWRATNYARIWHRGIIPCLPPAFR